MSPITAGAWSTRVSARSKLWPRWSKRSVRALEVAVDSGFTRGAEVCKALALGARAVGIGRLQCWGLAVGGAGALERALEILEHEISSTMANIGCRSVADITPGHVRWSIASPPT